MNRPIIGITCCFNTEEENFWLKRTYANAVLRAGGIPLAVPHLQGLVDEADNILDRIDGLMLSGGSDLDPNLFEEEPRFELIQIDPIRDGLEIELTKRAIDRDFPILAICRGIQVLNVAAGGDIYQDINEQKSEVLSHNQDAPRWHRTHRVEIEGDSLLREIVSEGSIMVNSFHHQNVREVAEGFRAVARSSDGLIEAIERRSGAFQLGIQWHPEAMVEEDKNAGLIFARFVEVAEGSQGRKGLARSREIEG